ncbi:MAG: GIY-YIG nuclease family protein [Rhodospirillales bacterium]|nr:GIY-YIG nuclease family protein [Rhodospirillales bacterium]
MEKGGFVYILTTRKNTVLYTGVTSDMMKRIWEHKQGVFPGFTKKYSVTKLVYCEQHHDMNEAITREKCIKKWNRDWKIQLIEKNNPEWKDLYETMTNPVPAFAGMTQKEIVKTTQAHNHATTTH